MDPSSFFFFLGINKPFWTRMFFTILCHYTYLCFFFYKKIMKIVINNSLITVNIHTFIDE